MLDKYVFRHILYILNKRHCIITGLIICNLQKILLVDEINEGVGWTVHVAYVVGDGEMHDCCLKN